MNVRCLSKCVAPCIARFIRIYIQLHVLMCKLQKCMTMTCTLNLLHVFTQNYACLSCVCIHAYNVRAHHVQTYSCGFGHKLTESGCHYLLANKLADHIRKYGTTQQSREVSSSMSLSRARQYDTNTYPNVCIRMSSHSHEIRTDMHKHVHTHTYAHITILMYTLVRMEPGGRREEENRHV
jgi:hypothetical protein